MITSAIFIFHVWIQDMIDMACPTPNCWAIIKTILIYKPGSDKPVTTLESQKEWTEPVSAVKPRPKLRSQKWVIPIHSHRHCQYMHTYKHYYRHTHTLMHTTLHTIKYTSMHFYTLNHTNISRHAQYMGHSLSISNE